MTVFKFRNTDNELFVFLDAEAVVEWIIADLEETASGDFFDYKIEVSEMDEADYDNLPEFDG
jgi:hypothetical protein